MTLGRPATTSRGRSGSPVMDNSRNPGKQPVMWHAFDDEGVGVAPKVAHRSPAARDHSADPGPA
jgi:hypothetical protein